MPHAPTNIVGEKQSVGLNLLDNARKGNRVWLPFLGKDLPQQLNT